MQIKMLLCFFLIFLMPLCLHAEEATPSPVKDNKKVIQDDIQEAMNNRLKMREENKCYYWVYHKVEVSGLYYHSRKIRDCNEYDYDLD